MNQHKVALLIPYFGKVPDYFDLWAQSAGKNENFTFFLFSDLPFNVEPYRNIRLVNMSFEQLKTDLQNLMDFKISLKTPYKLCDYKPAYGHVFADYIQEFDFWGFCDIDLILGDIGQFITDELLERCDKLLFSGHFCLMRNEDRMNLLYRRMYDNVQDYRFAFTTDLCCHFDENGTIAYANEYDESIRFYFDWIFFDTYVYSYELKIRDSEACVEWNKGKLTAYWDDGRQSQEYMYIHLQKRKMLRYFEGTRECYAIMRNEFLPMSDGGVHQMLRCPVDADTKAAFEADTLKRRRQILWGKVLSGWAIFKAVSVLKKWRREKNLSNRITK